MISTRNQTDLLPVAICDGGIKLSTKARSEPQKPRPARNTGYEIATITETKKDRNGNTSNFARYVLKASRL